MPVPHHPDHGIPPSSLDDPDPASDPGLDESPRPDHRIRPTRKTCRSAGAALAGVGAHMRRKIRGAYRSLGGTFDYLNDQRRELLSEAIFRIENDLEHRQPGHPQVRRMRAARNRLYDDLGWNEYAHRSQEHVHAA
jgi:hypothetical protein